MKPTYETTRSSAGHQYKQPRSKLRPDAIFDRLLLGGRNLLYKRALAFPLTLWLGERPLDHSRDLDKLEEIESPVL